MNIVRSNKYIALESEIIQIWRVCNMGLFDKFKKKNKQITFIENAGGVIITKSIYEGTSKLKWLFREVSVNPSDNGWRAMGDTDTQEYIDNPENSMVVDFNTLANIEPAVLAVYDMPIGTDLEFCFDNTGRYFIDSKKKISVKEKTERKYDGII